MGRIARLLSFVRAAINGTRNSDVKADPGGSANVTAQHFQPVGDDSHPLPDDYVAMLPLISTGRYGAVGYVDPKNEQKAQAGEKRLYARNDSGDEVVQIWLKNTGDVLISNDNATFEIKIDGSIKGANSNGSYELQASGDFVVNGATIDTSGNITSPGTVSAVTVSGSSSVQAAGKELAGHIHFVPSAPGNSNPNT